MGEVIETGFTLNELQTELQTLQTKTYQGPDHIINDMLTHLGVSRLKLH